VIEWLAWAGAALSSLITLPQTVRLLRGNSRDGVSATTYWLTVANACVWAAWAVTTGQLVAALPSAVNGPAATVVLVQLHRGRRWAGGAATSSCSASRDAKSVTAPRQAP
jgi:uncharacterized protein with PQ loop repeat